MKHEKDFCDFIEKIGGILTGLGTYFNLVGDSFMEVGRLAAFGASKYRRRIEKFERTVVK